MPNLICPFVTVAAVPNPVSLSSAAGQSAKPPAQEPKVPAAVLSASELLPSQPLAVKAEEPTRFASDAANPARAAVNGTAGVIHRLMHGAFRLC